MSGELLQVVNVLECTLSKALRSISLLLSKDSALLKMIN